MPPVSVTFRDENLYLRSMKHTILFLSIAALVIAGCGECVEGVGEPISERRTLNEFSTVEVGANIRVMINQGTSEDGHYVIIESEPNLVPEIVTEVNRGGLKIETSQCIQSATGIVVHVFAPNYSELNLNGTGSLETTAWLTAENLKVGNKGTGAVMLDLRTSRLELNNSGTGDVVVRGKANDVDITNRGTGDVQAQGLRAENANVNSKGTGDVRLQVHGALDIKLSGTGDVIYEGNPQDIQQSNSGTGEIRRD